MSPLPHTWLSTQPLHPDRYVSCQVQVWRPLTGQWAESIRGVRVLGREDTDDEIKPARWRLPTLVRRALSALIHRKWEYLVRRFDRTRQRRRIRIKALAHARLFPDWKDAGDYEPVASVLGQGRALKVLRSFTQRLAFAILIDNGDVYLKHRSLLYRAPRLAFSPAYPLVCVAYYRTGAEPNAPVLKREGTTPDQAQVSSFPRLPNRLKIPEADPADHGLDTVTRVRSVWPTIADILSGFLSCETSSTTPFSPVPRPSC